MGSESIPLAGQYGRHILRLYHLYRLSVGLLLVLLISSNLDDDCALRYVLRPNVGNNIAEPIDVKNVAVQPSISAPRCSQGSDGDYRVHARA